MRVVNNVQSIGFAGTYLVYQPLGTQYHTWLYGSILVTSNKEKEIKITTINSPACTGRTSDISEKQAFRDELAYSVQEVGAPCLLCMLVKRSTDCGAEGHNLSLGDVLQVSLEFTFNTHHLGKTKEVRHLSLKLKQVVSAVCAFRGAVCPVLPPPQQLRAVWGLVAVCSVLSSGKKELSQIFDLTWSHAAPANCLLGAVCCIKIKWQLIPLL